uniref:Uncharacterized protein n=1 Tax=Nelumbo nucifera TaxID=4432 RepID=A0A822Z7X2_NELNU|nr:TPA_asm: hypothetical protein HUJ06_015023 [Nelumbo nucifera]
MSTDISSSLSSLTHGVGLWAIICVLIVLVGLFGSLACRPREDGRTNSNVDNNVNKDEEKGEEGENDNNEKGGEENDSNKKGGEENDETK